MMSPPISSPAFAVVPLCLCVLMTGPACFYTGRINGRPSVQIVGLESHFRRGETVLVNALGDDPDGDPLRYTWYVIPGACGAPPDAAVVPTSLQAPPLPVGLSHEAIDSLCVWVTVTDSDGAVSSPASAFLTTSNRPPTAVIDVQQPAPNVFGRYDLYSVFRLGGARSSDPDGDAIVARAWTLALAPDTSSATLVPCAPTPPSDQVICLDVGAVPGQYIVELKVSDGFEYGPAVQVRLDVDPDHPPCVNDTDPAPEASPIVWDPAEAKAFTVNSVVDDGAPYPAPTDGAQHYPPTFAWSLRRNGGTWDALVGFDALNKVELPGGTFVSGERVDVRVVVSDGLATHQLLAPSGCVDTVVWTVEYR